MANTFNLSDFIDENDYVKSDIDIISKLVPLRKKISKEIFDLISSNIELSNSLL
jgi:hypothetical protein